MTDIRPRAAVIATLGAVAVAASAYFVWLSDQSPLDIQLQRLLLQTDSTDPASTYWMSMATPLVAVAAIGVLGTLLLSRLLVWLAFLLGLANLALWVTSVVYDAAPGELSVGAIQPGAWINLGGIVLLLVGAATLRRRGDEDEEDEDDFATQPLTRQGASDDGP
jgi:hypothetical protein